MRLNLPQPSQDALEVSRALQAHVADEIRRQSGWISFARYMELVLYTPGLGYYSGGAAKLGKEGDFTTAPEMTPLFGQAIAQVAAALIKQTSPQIIEFGAGSGRLAFDMLNELRVAGVQLAKYAIVDVSGELRARQRELLRGFDEVVWLDELPAAFSGVAIGNEVLDAMAVHLVVKTAAGWMERGVALKDDDSAGFAYADRPADPSLAAEIPDADALPLNYVTEVHPAASAFARTLALMLRAGQAKEDGGGAAILIDYGFPAHEYYLAQRSGGTLMCHYRHHAHDDPFYLPGLQDITAHVNFTSIAQSAVDAGIDLLAYSSQAAFLLNAGIGDLLMRTPIEDQKRYLLQTNALQKLISPAEMGELFKVMVLGSGVRLPDGFSSHDRSIRL